jgi:hypothetical protein
MFRRGRLIVERRLLNNAVEQPLLSNVAAALFA